MSNDEQTKVEAPILQELQGEVTSPADEAVMKEWREEVGKERSEVLKHVGQETVDLVTAHGATVAKQEVDAMRAEGQDVAAHTTAGRQA